MFAKDHRAVTEEDMTELKMLFSEAEIAALFAFMGFFSGAQKFAVAMGLPAWPETP